MLISNNVYNQAGFLSLSGNRLSGSVPIEFCDNFEFLEFLVVDCTGFYAQTDCDCCKCVENLGELNVPFFADYNSTANPEVGTGLR